MRTLMTCALGGIGLLDLLLQNAVEINGSRIEKGEIVRSAGRKIRRFGFIHGAKDIPFKIGDDFANGERIGLCFGM